MHMMEAFSIYCNASVAAKRWRWANRSVEKVWTILLKTMIPVLPCKNAAACRKHPWPFPHFSFLLILLILFSPNAVDHKCWRVWKWFYRTVLRLTHCFFLYLKVSPIQSEIYGSLELGESNVARCSDAEIRIQHALKLANVDLGW